jgi:deoxyribodipyrimidine photolyase-related protein
MKLHLILYNQINKKYFDTNISEHFLYIHNNGKIIFQWEELKLNTKSYILDYAMWYNFINEINNSWLHWKFIVWKNYYSTIVLYCIENNFTEIELIQPTENYVYQNFLKIKDKLLKDWITLNIMPDKISFFMNHQDFKEQYKKPPVMENFYRFMRKKHDILMEDQKPMGWEWNYDKLNRKFDKNHNKSWNFKLDKENSGIVKAKKYYSYEGIINYPTTRTEAINLLNYFVKNHLEYFGQLEDAMYIDDTYVHHSNISTAMNFGLLQPQEVVNIIHKQDTAINNKEWYIRQLLWWREYMYHFFHFYKNEIYKNNFFWFTKKLPDYFWDTEKKTDLNCLNTVVKRVLNENYSHHIERLMIIGNFTLLNWIDPHEVNKWFFEKYIDAFEWVVSPNVLAMSQYSDGWKLATKPYISSWNYINKMSNYCKNCTLNIKTKYEKDSCSFNYLYWNFVSEHKEVFQKTRQPFVVKNLEKVDIEKINEIKKYYIEKNNQ